ncbi:uncharacterized protein TNCT_731271 [Trichonephila clavata]|uniref:Uncharacterized protein n=1 Tax=Trichonephila clavata TaxID=2740835 RepID=A0A8X6KKS8_TRICU|nr:uncharacterized protein TNCT_731271 [Trichonephila clavata]
MSVNILSEKEVIALLYTLNIIMTIHSIDASYTNALQRSRMVRKPAIVRSIRTVEMDYGYKEPKCSNMYIEHWKKTNIYLSPQFPLERLAYLNSVLHFCDRKHIFFLRNSQMKELTSKKVNPKHCDEECHPSKLVTDLFSTYIHRRALFFRSRNVPSAGKKQFTKSYFYQKRNENLENFEHTLLYRKEREEQLKGVSISSHRDLGKKREESEFEPRSEAASNQENSDSEEKYSRRHFKRLKNAVKAVFRTEKDKSKDKESEENNIAQESKATHVTTDEESLYSKS